MKFRSVVCWINFVFIVLCGNTTTAQDQIERPLVHSLFTDHMVVQRDKGISVWGWTAPETTVTVSLNGESATAVADNDGKWRAEIGPFTSGGPHTMTVIGPYERVTLTDVMVGDVWVCSGQSNMEWPVRLSNSAAHEIAAANHQTIRLFTVPKRIAGQPQVTVEGQWQVCSSQTIPNFSAVGYFFGRELNTRLNVPIGLIHTSWGGTVAEAWTSAEALAEMKDFRDAVAGFTRDVAAQESGSFPLQARVAEWWKKNDAGSGDSGWESVDYDAAGWRTMKLPTNWEAANVGLEQFDGVVWFRRSFELPRDWSAVDTVLSLGPIDDIDTTWVNGRRVGEMQQWNVPRSYQVAAEFLHPGRNEIAIRVLDLSGGGGIFGDPKNMQLKVGNDGAAAIPLAGDWRFRIGKSVKNLTPFPQPAVGSNPNVVTVLYNGMLAPLTPFGIRGAIWYQGESNAGRARQYRTLLPTMIRDWRNRFDQGDFPFLVVQLANFMKPQEQPVESGWAELREAQLLTAVGDPKVGLAVTTDIGEANDIHPRNKQDVGTRLALSALAIEYGQDIVHSGPTFKDMAIEGSNLRVIFDNVGAGLVARGGELKGFAIAENKPGEKEREFVWAKARIEGDSIVLWSDELLEPWFVRYNWANNPIGNLFNAEGLPAVPFRTDVEW